MPLTKWQKAEATSLAIAFTALIIMFLIFLIIIFL